jgi:hypothetical protein
MTLTIIMLAGIGLYLISLAASGAKSDALGISGLILALIILFIKGATM